jgi:hypothetical protein
MPQLKLTAAEALLVSTYEDEAARLEEQARGLLGEAQARRGAAFRAVFESHSEPLPEGVAVKAVTDARGRPSALEWEKGEGK